MRPYLTKLTTTKHNLTLLCSGGGHLSAPFGKPYHNFKNNLKDNIKDNTRDNIRNSIKDSIKNYIKENINNKIKDNIKNEIKCITKTTSIQWVVTSS